MRVTISGNVPTCSDLMERLSVDTPAASEYINHSHQFFDMHGRPKSEDTSCCEYLRCRIQSGLFGFSVPGKRLLIITLPFLLGLKGEIKMAKYLTAFLILLMVSTAQAQAPDTIMYQGRLTDAAGIPIVGDSNTTFSIYRVETGGTAVFDQPALITTDDNGIFTIELGPLNETVLDGNRLWLGITVESDPEMEPRQLLTSTPYSMATRILPGIASSYNNNAALTGTTTAITSVTINCPASGYVLVQAVGWFYHTHTSGAGDQIARASIHDSANSINFNNFAYSRIESGEEAGDHTDNWSLLATFSVPGPGSYSYYLNADVWLGSTYHPANTACYDSHLVATFYPVSYGPVQ